MSTKTSSREILTEDILSEEWAGDQESIDDRALLQRGQRRFEQMCSALAELPEGFSIERVREVSATPVAVGDGGSQAEFYRELTRAPGMQRLDIVCRWVVIDERPKNARPVASVVRRRYAGGHGITCSPVAAIRPDVARAVSVALLLAAADAEGRPADH